MARLHLILSVLCVCVSCCVCKVVMHGQLQSPQYPEPYPSNVHQQWDLEVPHGYQLQISFQFLDIEPSFNCCNDSLMILHDNQVLGKFCGQNSTDPHHPGNNPILSPRNRLQLVFVTDKSNTDAHFGFSAFYTAVDIDECSSPDLDDSELRCTQICLNTLGSYLCTCHHGYLLQQDQRTCVLCGRPVVDIAGGHGRIFGGQLAKNNSFPWQVFLQTSGRGGAIVIGEKWLLTAAHTFNNDDMSKDEIKVFVGSNKVSNYFKGNTQFKPLPVESFHIHPGFKSPDFNNDIALIKLSSSITFNAGVMPVCLPEQDSELQNSGWVSGFGLTETYHTANHLRYIALPIVDQEVCRLSFEEVKKTFSDVSSLTENMFCAGLPEGGKDTCQGDAGSGFVTKKNDVFYAAGIVSWGVDCAKAGRFGVYTRVARYSKWIQNIMEETQ